MQQAETKGLINKPIQQVKAAFYVSGQRQQAKAEGHGNRIKKTCHGNQLRQQA